MGEETALARCVITRAPFRISFVGGGTDLPAYLEHDWGAVTSIAVTKYMYIILNRRYTDGIRVSYSRTEHVKSIDEVEHSLVRAILKHYGIPPNVEIASVADLCAGSGMGSSAAYTVALVRAFCQTFGYYPSATRVAEEAFHVEGEMAGEPVGKQDHYATALGGANHLRFTQSGQVLDRPIPASVDYLERLTRCILLFPTGKTRNSRDILQPQQDTIASRLPLYRRLRDLALRYAEIMGREGRMWELGRVLDEGWKVKRECYEGISFGLVDEWYVKALDAGGLGGKLLGAGGGGFLMILAEPQQAPAIESAIGKPAVRVGFCPEGAKVLYAD